MSKVRHTSFKYGFYCHHFMVTNHNEGWNKRNVRYEEIHGFSPENLELLASSLHLSDGQTYLDLMSGYGAVTKAVLDHCQSRGISVKPILVDSSKEQLARSIAEVPADFPRLCEDVRSLSLLNCSVDRISIKMGLHEVPRKDQYRVIEQAYRVLKPAGEVAIWELMFKDHTEQLTFQAIIHEKNRLAGFYDMALNRYLPREEEVRDYLGSAGFEKIELVKEIPYRFSSEKRLHAEFGGDESKLAEWNDFIRAVVSPHARSTIDFIDNGRTIEATFRKAILRAVKPSGGNS